MVFIKVVGIWNSFPMPVVSCNLELYTQSYPQNTVGTSDNIHQPHLPTSTRYLTILLTESDFVVFTKVVDNWVMVLWPVISYQLNTYFVRYSQNTVCISGWTSRIRSISVVVHFWSIKHWIWALEYSSNM